MSRKGQISQEVVYGLTSLSAKQADPARLLHLNRARLPDRKSAPLEARCHGWREDHCQVRMGSAPQVLAALNNVVLSLADALQVSNLAAQMRQFDAHPEQALALLLASNF